MAATLDASDISNAVLAGLFGLLFVLYAVAIWLRRVPVGGTTKTFLFFILCTCFFRAIQLAIPNSVYGVAEHPEATNQGWGNSIRFALYSIGYGSMTLEFLWLLRMSDVAICVLNNWDPATSRTARALTYCLVGYALWEVVIIACGFLIPYPTVLVMSSASYALSFIAITVALAAFWVQLWRALTIVTLHRSKLESLSDALVAVCGGHRCATAFLFACCFCCGGARVARSTLSIAASVGPNSNVANARAKLTRFSLLVAVFTLASVNKVVVLSYMVGSLLGGEFQDGSDSFAARNWWVVVLCDFLATEIFVAASVLLILWQKGPMPPSSASSSSSYVPPKIERGRSSKGGNNSGSGQKKRSGSSNSNGGRSRSRSGGKGAAGADESATGRDKVFLPPSLASVEGLNTAGAHIVPVSPAAAAAFSVAAAASQHSAGDHYSSAVSTSSGSVSIAAPQLQAGGEPVSSTTLLIPAAAMPGDLSVATAASEQAASSSPETLSPAIFGRIGSPSPQPALPPGALAAGTSSVFPHSGGVWLLSSSSTSAAAASPVIDSFAMRFSPQLTLSRSNNSLVALDVDTVSSGAGGGGGDPSLPLLVGGAGPIQSAARRVRFADEDDVAFVM